PLAGLVGLAGRDDDLQAVVVHEAVAAERAQRQLGGLDLRRLGGVADGVLGHGGVGGRGRRRRGALVELGGGEAAGQAGGQRRGGQQGQDRLLHGGRSFVRWAVLTSSDRKNVTALGRGAQRVQRSRSTRSSHRGSCHAWPAWLHICVGSGSATPARCSARPANRPSTMSTRIKATRRPVCSWLI